MARAGSINVSHGGHIGDIVYGMAYAKQLSIALDSDINIFIRSDQKDGYSESMHHHNKSGFMVSAESFDYIKPLLLNESWVRHVEYRSSKDLEGAIPLDIYRFSQHISQVGGNISVWPRKLTGLQIDTCNPWLSTQPAPVPGRVVCAFSFRFRNVSIDYSVLNAIDDVLFVGLEQEAIDFINRYGLKRVKYVITKNALEMAYVIASSQLFIGNQSMPFAIAESIKLKRALESFELIPNVIPNGPGAREYITNQAFYSILKQEGLIDADTPGPVADPEYKMCII